MVPGLKRSKRPQNDDDSELMPVEARGFHIISGILKI
jgi:hypothetical protein